MFAASVERDSCTRDSFIPSNIQRGINKQNVNIDHRAIEAATKTTIANK